MRIIHSIHGHTLDPLPPPEDVGDHPADPGVGGRGLLRRVHLTQHTVAAYSQREVAARSHSTQSQHAVTAHSHSTVTLSPTLTCRAAPAFRGDPPATSVATSGLEPARDDSDSAAAALPLAPEPPASGLTTFPTIVASIVPGLGAILPGLERTLGCPLVRAGDRGPTGNAADAADTAAGTTATVTGAEDGAAAAAAVAVAVVVAGAAAVVGVGLGFAELLLSAPPYDRFWSLALDRSRLDARQGRSRAGGWMGVETPDGDRGG